MYKQKVFFVLLSTKRNKEGSLQVEFSYSTSSRTSHTIWFSNTHENFSPQKFNPQNIVATNISVFTVPRVWWRYIDTISAILTHREPSLWVSLHLEPQPLPHHHQIYSFLVSRRSNPPRYESLPKDDLIGTDLHVKPTGTHARRFASVRFVWRFCLEEEHLLKCIWKIKRNIK